MNSGQSENSATTPVKEVAEVKSTSTSSKSLPDNDYDMIFEESTENPEWWRELRVKKAQDGIQFKISVKNTPRDCQATISGEAKLKEGDMESRDNEQGESFFVQEYVYEGEDCGISISIDLDTESIAWISEFDCKNGHPTGCNFDIGRTLPRVP